MQLRPYIYVKFWRQKERVAKEARSWQSWCKSLKIYRANFGAQNWVGGRGWQRRQCCRAGNAASGQQCCMAGNAASGQQCYRAAMLPGSPRPKNLKICKNVKEYSVHLLSLIPASWQQALLLLPLKAMLPDRAAMLPDRAALLLKCSPGLPGSYLARQGSNAPAMQSLTSWQPSCCKARMV